MLLANLLPQVGEVGHVFLFVLARRMQPNDDGVGDVGIVAVINPQPILAFAVGRVAFQETGLGPLGIRLGFLDRLEFLVVLAVLFDVFIVLFAVLFDILAVLFDILDQQFERLQPLLGGVQ